MCVCWPCCAKALTNLHIYSCADSFAYSSPSPPPPPLTTPPPPPSPNPPLPPNGGYTTVAGTSTAFSYVGAYFADPALFFLYDTSIGQLSDKRGLIWTNLNAHWTYNTLDATGSCSPYPFSVTWSNLGSGFNAAAANVIKQCQDYAWSLGYDHVALNQFFRRKWFDSRLCATCSGCDSTKTNCNYYSGGIVPTPNVCSPGIIAGLYDAPGTMFAGYELPNTTQCNHAGCGWCLNATLGMQPVMQIYRKTPPEVTASASIPIYVGAGTDASPPPPLPPSRSCAAYVANGGVFSRCVVTVPAGATIKAGTTGVPGASCSGDTYLKLSNSAETVLTFSDDYGGSLCSYMQYTVSTAGTYTILQGCYSTGSCNGVVAYTF